MTDVGGTPVVMTGGNGDYGMGGSGCWLIALIALMFGGFDGRRGRDGFDGADWGRSEHQHMDTREEIRFNEASTQAQINELSSDLYQRQIFSEICDVNRNVDAASAANLAATADAKYDNALLLKDMALDNLKCCCETQKMIAASECAILSRFDAFENQNLRDKVSELQLGLSQCNQNQTLINTLRPCPVPAFQTCNPWAANNGCCGNGCF